MSTLKRILSLVFTLSVLVSGWSSVYAQQPDSRYFSETGHWVNGDFLARYQAVKDPLLVYGYPITDEFQDPLTGLQVQYFQRARFELHLEEPEGQQVQLSNLGELLYEPGQAVTASTETQACRYFPKQKHSVCYAFLDFFNRNGGVSQFGYPVSDIEIQDNLYVQYFERARFEWHPELPAGQRVALADLGRIYFDQSVGEPSLLEPNLSSNIPQSAIQVQARAFVSKALISNGNQQIVFVIVQDQYLRPVAQANVAITIRLPSGNEERHRLPLTGADGISQFEFTVKDQPQDEIAVVQAIVSQGGQEALANTWFRVWW